MMKKFYSPADYDPLDSKNIKVEKISPDKKLPPEIPLPETKRSSKSFLPAKLYRLLEERAEDLLSEKEEKIEEVDNSLYLAVEKFISLLEQLKKENISYDFRFSEELSAAWLILNEEASMQSKQRTPPTYYPKLKSFLGSLMRYPEKSDHTFGYYLNQYAGEKWLPFPFIDLLSKLHEDFLLLKEKSTLSTWTLALDSLLKNLIEEET
jgi:hypothetical protein